MVEILKTIQLVLLKIKGKTKNVLTLDISFGYRKSPVNFGGGRFRTHKKDFYSFGIRVVIEFSV